MLPNFDPFIIRNYNAYLMNHNFCTDVGLSIPEREFFLHKRNEIARTMIRYAVKQGWLRTFNIAPNLVV